MRGLLTTLFLANLLVAGCARHVVVERDSGNVDSARSITSKSDAEWNVQHEPAPRADQER